MNNVRLAECGGQLRILFVAVSFLCFVFSAFADPRPPQPPWPQPTLKIFGFDSPYQKVPWRDVAFNEEESTLVESWSGYALERSGLFLSPIVIPVRVSDKEVNLDPSRGSIRFWLAPNWSTASEKTGGKGPGHLAHLLELVNLNGKVSDARWALFLNEAGDTLHFVGQTKLGLTEILRAPVAFMAGDWRMITLCYSETNTVLLLDNEVIAKGEGVMAPVKWAETDLGLVVGTDVLASSESLAEAQFEELTTMRQWPSQSDWQALYFKGTKWRNLLGALGTKEEEQAKVAVLKAAGLLPEDYGLAKNSGEGDGPIVANSYAEGSLWLEITGVTNGLASLNVHGTTEDVAYEILSTDSLTNAIWAGEQVILGAGRQDWTPTTVTVGTRTNHLFLWARTLVDTDGDGLPDWWELDHGLDPNNPDTGNAGVSDGYKDSDNDGWNNLEEYQNGTNPGLFTTPPPPQGLTVFSHGADSTVNISWQRASGPVTSYTIDRWIPELNHYDVFTVSANTNAWVDNFPPTAPNFGYWPPTYRIQASYAAGNSTWSEEVSLWDTSSTLTASLVRGPHGSNYLTVSLLSPNTVALRLTRTDSTYPTYLFTNFTIWATNLVGGTFALPDPWVNPTASVNGYGYASHRWHVQAVSATGAWSDPTALGWSHPEPFYDGRAQLKQNLHFLLRAASANRSFGYTDFYTWPGEYYDEVIVTPSNYAYAGFWGTYSSPEYSEAYTDVFRPFRENYTYRNFAFDPTNLWSSGWLRSGVTWGYFYGDDLTLHHPSSFEFQYPTNQSPIAPRLSANESQWMVWPDDVPFITGLPDWDLGVSAQTNLYSMASGARNLYGLPYLSFKLAWGSNATSMATLSPTSSVIAGGDRYFYPETAAPAFQNLDYYFALGSDSYLYNVQLPGHSAFSPTNTTPLLMASAGQPLKIAGYAKLAVANGYPGVYGYLGQYFDKAYKTTNGVVTTNQTGILSPYGEFFPTEPGLTALVTMPDLDTGARGTATVHVIKLQLDVNHDGAMDLSFVGPDNTSQNKPYAFWANNDCDWATSDSDPGEDRNLATQYPNIWADYITHYVRSRRDLEDWTRLWICGMPALTNAGCQVTLSWSNVSGSPAINLLKSVETNGSIGYLTNQSVAVAQAVGYTYASLKYPTITPTNTLTLPANLFTNSGNKYFLFEGAGVGSGQLVLTIAQETNVLAQTSTWLDLRDVKGFYERAVITNSVSGAISNMTSGVHTVEYATASALGEDQDIIVLVHGINVSDTDWRIQSDTVLKRLYWAGFQGKFATVKWPCNYLTPPSPLTVDVFNLSEAKAYKTSRALTNYLNELRSRFPDDRLHLLVHSQGNAVVSEAIMQSGVMVDTYILTQGAIPASAYDVNAPTNAAMAATDTGTFITPEWQPMGYHGIYTNLHGRIVNFYNTNDPVLAVWELDQKIRKPSFDYYYNGTNTLYNPLFGSSYTVTDPQESRAMVSRSRTLSIGQSPPETGHGVIQLAIDLHARYGFDKAFPDDHSAQWVWPIQTTRPYFQQVLTSCQIQPAP